MNVLFASTASGLEELLKSELQALGAHGCRIVQGGVWFQGDTRVLYQSLLWSRLASRILLLLHSCHLQSTGDLYAGAQMVDWPAIFTSEKTFAVYFNGINDVIRNSQYGALKVKDAIVDCFMNQTGQRPDVMKQQPDIRISVFLTQNKVSLLLDLSGEALHRRGYRDRVGLAPLKENLAAAIVLRSAWQPGTPMVDPLCGSGTLLIEAAMMATDRAPGLGRQHWGFSAWLNHDKDLWSALIDEAEIRAVQGLLQTRSRFAGFDSDSGIIEMACTNARRAGVAELMTFETRDISGLVNPYPPVPVGTVISNPPYGERLESQPALMALYHLLGNRIKQAFGGWRFSVFSTDAQLLSCLQLRAEREFKAKNGALDCIQKNYLLAENHQGIATTETGSDFARRLGKNMRKLDKWAQQQGIECYRLYDADLPDYNVAIDRYGSKVVVQEYAAPKIIEASKARQRLLEVINQTLCVLALNASQLILKTRERQQGKNQYQKLAQQGELLLVTEYNARFWVNLTDYLDTGLFADHRITRRLLGEMSRGKDFLNLFAYTGTATVYAGLGGARSTTTVDMSSGYLKWAEKNMHLNGLTGRQHRLIQADCLSWLCHHREQFDVIFIDPPTFSNSSRMETTFDVQRDHVMLLKAARQLLHPAGKILFSSNKKGFQMDVARLADLKLTAKDISIQTLSRDFARRPGSHHCWLLGHTSEEHTCH